MRAFLCSVLLLLGTAGAFAMDPKDPYAWLEDVHGSKPLAWVAGQNRTSLGLLKADPRYARNYDSILSVLDAPDRIPYGGLDHGFVYNFWQDAKNPKGLWRRATIAEYRSKTPRWDVLLDLDALAKAERENWVWKAAECNPGQTRCLIQLSRGGGDAVVVREFDLKARGWAADGFALPEAKTDATYRDDDTVLFATAKDGQTSAGYARIVRQWKRGSPIKAAPVVYEGKAGDVLSAPAVFHTARGTVALAIRAVSFFENEYFRLDGTRAVKLKLPLSADLKGVFDGAYIATLREDFGGFKKGALAAFRNGAPNQLILDPGPRAGIEGVGVGRDKLYAAVTRNVIGAVHVFTTNGKGWSDKVLPLPGNGTPDVVATDDYGPEAMFGFENYLIPPTLYFDGGDDRPEPIKALPARFDASGMVTEQFEATSKDGTKIPYFVTRPKKLSGPAPAILYGYGGFEVSLTPAYSANFGRLWVRQGGLYVVANIRGGGEFGPAWHEAAEKAHRQRAFDDFAAVAADLIRRRLTTSRQLGIMGGSNGGLLVSTVMVQHPELFGAVVCQVPLIDMIAYTHIGAGRAGSGNMAIRPTRKWRHTFAPTARTRM